MKQQANSTICEISSVALWGCSCYLILSLGAWGGKWTSLRAFYVCMENVLHFLKNKTLNIKKTEKIIKTKIKMAIVSPLCVTVGVEEVPKCRRKEAGGSWRTGSLITKLNKPKSTSEQARNPRKPWNTGRHWNWEHQSYGAAQEEGKDRT